MDHELHGWARIQSLPLSVQIREIRGQKLPGYFGYTERHQYFHLFGEPASAQAADDAEVVPPAIRKDQSVTLQ